MFLLMLGCQPHLGHIADVVQKYSKKREFATFETHKSCQAATLNDEVALLEKFKLWKVKISTDFFNFATWKSDT